MISASLLNVGEIKYTANGLNDTYLIRMTLTVESAEH